MVLGWHGAKEETLREVSELGLAPLANDDGFWGRGNYIAIESEYACLYPSVYLGAIGNVPHRARGGLQ